MAESITISSNDPPLQSMNYALLREAGLQRIQELSGLVWSDNNAHDPGITMLEALAYAVTDLGYRTNYDIKDILTPNPSTTDIRNFFTAAQILPNAPVTINDYRKLLIDVECEEELDDETTLRYGVRNAWLERAKTECPFYVNGEAGKLQYEKPERPADAQPVDVRCLWNVLVELDILEDKFGGDLNENTIEAQFVIPKIPVDPLDPLDPLKPFQHLEGTVIELEVQFPRWDTPGIDWYSCFPHDAALSDSIKAHMSGVTASITRLPSDLVVEGYGLHANGDFWIEFNKKDASLSGPNPNDVNMYVAKLINELIYDLASLQPTPQPPSKFSLIRQYQVKVQRVLNVIRKVKETLMENRNLCEDFVNVNAVKVEEIALCADVELTMEADVEEVQAQIFHQVAKFLNPTIYFYTLDEMFAKGKTTDQIFEGPLLQHGFIVEEELVHAERHEVIHVSDLISIIMDIPGVVAVKSIQVANVPLDNDDNIPTHVVRWCLDLAIEHNYVPRLSPERSRITFFKDQLPFRAKSLEVEARLDALEIAERPQKQHGIPLDLPVPLGEFKDIENYYSIQEQFPLLYGIGSPGLPSTASPMRQAQAKQLKAYLLFFEQLLANYLSQLFHIKDLFSMNDELDPLTGDPVINKTYFSQSLLSLVPDAAPLYFETDPAENAEQLQAIAESLETYEQRRVRILEHLAARFAENFNDYALLVYTLDGKKAPAELIEDKLAFLNNYPSISMNRDKAFNYKDPCELWHVDNISGLERRASFLSGIDERLVSSLVFSSNFTTFVSGTGYQFKILTPTFLDLVSVKIYATEDEARLDLERAIVNGAQVEHYRVVDRNFELVIETQAKGGCAGAPDYFVELMCYDEPIARGSRKYNAGGNQAASYALAKDDIILRFVPTCQEEFYTNAESNRYNLACFFLKYIEVPLIPPDEDINENTGSGCPPDYTYHFDLFKDVDHTELLLMGEAQGQAKEGDTIQEVRDLAQEKRDELLFEVLRYAADPASYRFVYAGSPAVEIAELTDRCGNRKGELAESDFGAAIRADLQAITGTTLEIVKSADYDGFYTIVTPATANVIDSPQRPGWIDITVMEPLDPPTKVDGFVQYLRTEAVIASDPATRVFTIAPDVQRVLFPGEEIVITGGPNAGDYTVVEVNYNGSASEVRVKQAIPAAGTGSMEITKRLPIVNVDAASGTFSVAHGADVLAASEVAGFVKEKFFSHEGMHIVEHVLLRPQCKSTVWDPISKDNGLKNSSGPDGRLTLVVIFGIVKADPGLKRLEVQADLSDVLKVFTVIKAQSIDGFTTYQGTVKSFSLAGGRTFVTMHQPPPAQLSGGTMMFQCSVPIVAVNNDMIQVTARSFLKVVESFAVTYESSKIGNDGIYQVDDIGGNRMRALARLATAKDDFLPILLGDECPECNYSDPYSFIATVILPAWQGRFANQTFRRFFERTLRMECPAHILLNVCWIDCKQMDEFEFKLKQWLLEHSRDNRDVVRHSEALNELIDVMVRLRSAYPVGTLHDCEEEELKNSIILNQSIIGTL